MPRITALIVAAGSGSRMPGDLPKQYRPLGGVPMLRRTVAAFLAAEPVDTVRVVIDPDHREHYDRALAPVRLAPAVPGGATRQDSVRRGLEALAAEAPDLVLIHDGARPLVDAGIIGRVCAALATADGAIPAVALADTVKRLGEDGRLETVDRSGLWRAQTPQGFRYDRILAAHRSAAGLALTDDAAIAERAGLTLALVPGREDNLKITSESDLVLAERLLLGRQADIRIGSGFDVHRFTDGDHVMLCGVAVPHDQGLAGHSDADVGLHALTDAVLGAIAAGDIGRHFPPDDPRWRDADSARFLEHAAGLVAARGGAIAHADVTLICERPRIGPFRDRMVARIAELLGLAPDRVSVKATTTERLGFTGRGEGIAAQATATIRLPS